MGARRQGPKLAAELTRELSDYVQQRWQVSSRLELEFEKLYLKLFLPSVRGGASGARKRYAGLIDGSSDVEFVGMEVVRRDWTQLAKTVQRELYARLFTGQPVDEYLDDDDRCVRLQMTQAVLAERCRRDVVVPGAGLPRPARTGWQAEAEGD